MPELVELGPKLESRNVRLVAVSIDLALPEQVDTPEELRAFAEGRGIALPLLAFQGDFDAFTERHRLPGGPPFTLLFGPNGELGRIEGPAERSEIEALLETARAAER